MKWLLILNAYIEQISQTSIIQARTSYPRQEEGRRRSQITTIMPQIASSIETNSRKWTFWKLH